MAKFDTFQVDFSSKSDLITPFLVSFLAFFGIKLFQLYQVFHLFHETVRFLSFKSYPTLTFDIIIINHNNVSLQPI